MTDAEIVPGVNQESLSALRHSVSEAALHVPWIQIDFSDESLVPTRTCTDIDGINSVVAAHPHVSFEAHLMVAHPEKYVAQLAAGGFKRLIAHVEAVDPRLFLDEVQLESVEVGIAIDGPTEFEQIEPFLESVDVALVMTIESGPSGQPFLPETVEKIQQIRENLPDLPIEVDGGITDKTAKIVKDAGATRLVSTSFVFKHPDGIAQAVELLRRA